MQFTVNLWAGETVSVEANVVEDALVVEVNGMTLNADMVEHAIQFGFRQLIRDAGAGAESDEKRNELAMKKVDALIKGTLRQGSGGGPKLSMEERRGKEIAMRKVVASVSAKKLTMTQKAMAELAEKLYARDKAQLVELAKAELAAEAEEADIDLGAL